LLEIYVWSCFGVAFIADLSVNRVVQLVGTYNGCLTLVRYVEWNAAEGRKRHMQCTCLRPFCFVDLCVVSHLGGGPQAQHTLQLPLAGGLSLQGSAGFPQKLRGAAAASYGQLEPVCGHTGVLHRPPLPPPAAHKGKAASCKQQTA